jgi:hypothetical protein
MAAGADGRSLSHPKCHVTGDVKKFSRPYRFLQVYADNGELHQPKEQTMTMTETKTTNEDNRNKATGEQQPSNAHANKSLTHLEARLRKARLDLAEAKVEQAKKADRGKRIREQKIGQIMLELIEQDMIDPPVVALLRDEVKKTCRQSRQVAAFAGSLFE